MAQQPKEQRRDALKIIGAVSATCAFPFSADELYGQQDHGQHTPAKEAALGPAKYFSAAEMKLLANISDHIIPASGTPAASGAQVPAYIDYVVSGNKDLQRNFKEGFAWLAKSNYEALDAPAQLALLMPLCRAADSGKISTPEQRWFRSMKSLTADGYYTSKPGMVDELGYKGGSVLAEYPECIHEH